LGEQQVLRKRSFHEVAEAASTSVVVEKEVVRLRELKDEENSEDEVIPLKIKFTDKKQKLKHENLKLEMPEGHSK
jgi:hypothetical protein